MKFVIVIVGLFLAIWLVARWLAGWALVKLTALITIRILDQPALRHH